MSAGQQLTLEVVLQTNGIAPEPLMSESVQSVALLLFAHFVLLGLEHPHDG
jgi:hypothetical protein